MHLVIACSAEDIDIYRYILMSIINEDKKYVTYRPTVTQHVFTLQLL